MYIVKKENLFLTGKKKVENATTSDIALAKNYVTQQAAKMQAGWAEKNLVQKGWEVAAA